MKINVNQLKNELSTLNDLLDEYETNYLNLYNEVSSLFTYWNDGRTETFEKVTQDDKIQLENSCTSMKSIKEIYDTLVTRYEKLGDKIEFVTTNSQSLMTKFETYLNKFNSAINSYSNLDLVFCSKEGINVSALKRQISANKNKVLDVKNKIRTLINYVDDTEKEIKDMISKISIEDIKLKNNMTGELC